MTEPTPPQVETALKTTGQRRVNLIWEVTQACIALGVTFATLWVSANMALMSGTDRAAFLLLGNAFFLVIGFYFGRTNHQRMGGTGSIQPGETR